MRKFGISLDFLLFSHVQKRRINPIRKATAAKTWLRTACSYIALVALASSARMSFAQSVHAESGRSAGSCSGFIVSSSNFDSPGSVYLPPGPYGYSTGFGCDGQCDWSDAYSPIGFPGGGSFHWGGGNFNVSTGCGAVGNQDECGTCWAHIDISFWLLNQAPWANDSYYTINEDAATGSVGLSVGDPDGNLSDCPTGSSSLSGSFNRSGCSFSFSPSANWNGTAWFDFYASDSYGATSAWRRAYITVNAVNDAPVATNSTLTTNEDTAYSSTLPCTDIDGPSLTHSIVAQPANASVTITNTTTGAYTVTPATNWNGSTSFTFNCSDGQYTSNTGTMSITVTPVNDVPVFTKGADQTFVEDANGGAHTISGWATSISPSGGPDETGQALSFSVTNDNNSLFSVQPAISSNGELTFTSGTHLNGIATVTVILSDNGGTTNGGIDTSTAQTFIITITPYNYTLTVNNAAFSTSEDTSYNGLLTGNDPDPEDTFQFAIVTQPATGNGVVAITNAATGAFTYKPEPNWSGTASFTFNATDDSTAPGEPYTSAPAMVSITVTAVNDPPVVLVTPVSGQ